MIRTKPLTIPKNLVYNPPRTNSYRIIDTKNGQELGEMLAFPTVNKDVFIDSLIIFKQRRQGLGRFLLDFAQNMSKKMGFKGRMSVCAGILPEDPKNPPHIFYRKYGFSSPDRKILEIIDSHIKQKKQLNHLTTPNLIMYYNPEEKQKQ